MARTLGTAYQDKDEAVGYSVNWTPDLDGATLSSVSWDTGGLTSESQTNTTSVASIRLTGGTPGQTYIVTNTVTTSNGEDLQVQFLVQIDN